LSNRSVDKFGDVSPARKLGQAGLSFSLSIGDSHALPTQIQAEGAANKQPYVSNDIC
jgi:hypothetical protein